jgi:hypothetical protein
MTSLRANTILAAVLSMAVMAGCAKAEPDLPTFDPLDKVQASEGWKVGRNIAVSPGEKTPRAHHVQAIASGLHDVDFETPPTALVPVAPSCTVSHPGMGGGKYMLLGKGWTKFYLMDSPDFPGIQAFNNSAANEVAKIRIDTELGNKRKNSFQDSLKVNSITSNMTMQDVFITETDKSVFVVLAGDGLYNFNMKPDVKLSGVLVYSNSERAAVAGVPDHVNVEFVSKTHPATKSCWTRIQARPDASWREAKSRARDRNSRYSALKPHWKKFQSRVRKDIGLVPDENVVSVNRTDHFLIGPPPVTYEGRIPYVAFGGKTIRYMTADHARFGSPDDNAAYGQSVLDQYYAAHLKAGQKTGLQP